LGNTPDILMKHCRSLAAKAVEFAAPPRVSPRAHCIFACGVKLAFLVWQITFQPAPVRT
jgi:hypothetical protein